MTKAVMDDYQRHYAKCIANGCSPRLAEMLASQQPPAPQSDTRRAIGHRTLRDQCGGSEFATQQLVAAAKKHGYTPGYNDVYNSNLANKFGDPAAFIKPHEIAAHMKKVASKRGQRLVSDDGKVKVKGREPTEEPKRQKLAPSLIKAELRRRIKSCPEIAKAPIAEKRELCRQIVARYGQK